MTLKTNGQGSEVVVVFLAPFYLKHPSTMHYEYTYNALQVCENAQS